MRRPPLPTAIVLAATLPLTAFELWYWFTTALAQPYTSDFRNYYSAAIVGRQDGWSRIYDLQLQHAIAERIGPGFLPFGNPPVVAWLAAPLTLLPFVVAYWIWALLLLCLLLLGWWLAAPARDGWERAAQLTALLGFFPVAFALLIGQSTLLVAFGMALSWWLLRGRREVAAGLALALIVVKPQDAFLVPLALLVARRWRPLLAFAIASGFLGLLMVVSLGLSGLRQFEAVGALLASLSIGRVFAPLHVLSPWFALPLAGIALAAAFRAPRRTGYVYAAGMLASFLVTPYLSLQDYSVLFVAGWLCLRDGPTRPLVAVLSVGYMVGLFALPLGPLPLAVVVGAWAPALLAASFQDDEHGRAEQDDPERRKDAADHGQHHLQ